MSRLDISQTNTKPDVKTEYLADVTEPLRWQVASVLALWNVTQSDEWW